MAHWTEKRAACALLHDAVKANGWTMFGYKPDKSESMTDYYDPARWDGVATKNGYVLCVDVSPYDVESNSGKVEEEHYREETGDCPVCKGTGADPSGWTFEKAKADPKGFAVASLLATHNGDDKVKEVKFGDLGKDSVTIVFEDGDSMSDPFGASVVSPLLFRDDGKMNCSECHGNSKTFDAKSRPNGVVWPTFQANPKGSSWHLERHGKIEAKGVGVYSIGSGQYEQRPAKAKKLADKLTKWAGNGYEPNPDLTPTTGVTITERNVGVGQVPWQAGQRRARQAQGLELPLEPQTQGVVQEEQGRARVAASHGD